MTDLQSVLLWITIAGAVGGVINAITSDNGFLLPQKAETPSGGKILRPGFLANVFLGAIAAVLLFALYGPLKDLVVAGYRPPTGDGEVVATASLSLSALAGALLTGVGGARVITGEVDKKLLKAAVAQAAGADANAGKATEMANATPASVLEIASTMQ